MKESRSQKISLALQAGAEYLQSKLNASSRDPLIEKVCIALTGRSFSSLGIWEKHLRDIVLTAKVHHDLFDALITAEKSREGNTDLQSVSKKAAGGLNFYTKMISEKPWFVPRSAMKSYVDVSIPTAVVRTIFSGVVKDSEQSNVAMLKLVKRCLEFYPQNRAFLLLCGQLELELKDYPAAYQTALKTLRINAVCPDGQELLYDVIANDPSPNSEKSVYKDIGMQDLTDRFCMRPFTTLTTGLQGKSFLCDCPAYLPYPVGNVLKDKGAEDIWNSEAAVEIRRSILDGDFSYCSRTMCGLIREDRLPRKHEVSDTVLADIIANNKTHLESGPLSVQLSHDQSCNLACPSCRTEILTLKGRDQEPYEDSLDRVVLPLLRRTKGVVMLSGGGDPIASKHYRSILYKLNGEEFPEIAVALLTNALLLTEKEWARLKTVRPLIKSLLVSVDAARPDTYEIVRRPGNFDKLLTNLEMLSKARNDGDLHHYGLCFVVQKLNFREMPEFVDLGKRLGVDTIWFQKLENFGSFTDQEIVDADVSLQNHPLHSEFLKVLDHPSLTDPIVKMFGEFTEATAIEPNQRGLLSESYA